MAKTRKAKKTKKQELKEEPKTPDIFEQDDEEEDELEEDDEEEDEEEDEDESEDESEEDEEEEVEQTEDDEEEPDQELKKTVKRRGRKPGTKNKTRRTTVKRSANDEEFFSSTLMYLTKLSAYLYTMRQVVDNIASHLTPELVVEDIERKKNWAFKNLLMFEDERENLQTYLLTTRSSVYKTVVEQSFGEMKQEYADIRKVLHTL
jgi:hypothetical protein